MNEWKKGKKEGRDEWGEQERGEQGGREVRREEIGKIKCLKTLLLRILYRWSVKIDIIYIQTVIFRADFRPIW